MGLLTSLAKKAAEVALRQGGKAVKSAFASARDSIFGVAGDADRHEEEPKPDPFAKLKAAEAAKKQLEK